MLEITLERAVRDYIKKIGGQCFKWVCPGENGVPDRICVLPGGNIIFIELKRPGRKDGRSLRQKKMFNRLETLGCRVWLVNNLDELKEKLKNEI